MFLLQKILLNNSIKEIAARQMIKDKLPKQTTGFLYNINETVIEKEKYTRELFKKLHILRKIKHKKAVKRLKNMFAAAQLLQGFTASRIHKSKISSSCRYDKKSLTTFYKQNLVRYIVHINLTSTNTLVSVTDIKGNVKLFYSSGQVNLKGKQKTKQPAALINILKRLLLKAKFMQNEPLAIHFKNTRSHYEAFIVKMLKTKFFIKTIRSYNTQPHNGCRPKKIKRF